MTDDRSGLQRRSTRPARQGVPPATVPAMSAPLCVIGDFAWDVLIRTNTKLLTGGDTFGDVILTPGGSAANVAVWASRCGLQTEFIGKIGRDRLGQLAREDLAKERVITHFVETD